MLRHTRKRAGPPEGWSRPDNAVRWPEQNPNKSKRRLRQEILEFGGAGLFLFDWRDRIAGLIEAAQHGDLDALLVVHEEVDAWKRAVAAFGDWRATA